MTATFPPVTGTEPCRRVDPEVFFPGPGRNAEAAAAARLCRGCPVLLPCLVYAVKHEKYGVWAGTTPGQRQELRRLGRPEMAAGK